MDEGSWRSKVYKKRDKTDWAFWKRVRAMVIDNDYHRCQSCFRRQCPKVKLTVHHIIPRAEGGSEDLDNLITLCLDCHDAIEELHLRTREEIHGYFSKEKKAARELVEKQHPAELEDVLARIDAERPDWHSRVYGGQK